MKINRQNIAVIICFLIGSKMYGASFVYNLRISETTKRQAFSLKSAQPFSTTATFVNQFRELRPNIYLLFTGGLATFVYAQPSFYVRIDGAVARGRQIENNVKSSQTQGDDILLSGGYSYRFNDKVRATFSGLFGIPVHKDFLLQFDYAFGTGHIGLGAQIDSSLTYSPHRNHSIMTAVRFVHFFPRTTIATINNQNLPYKFTIGNLMDLFIAHCSIVGKQKMEVGYNPTFEFTSRIQPNVPGLTHLINFTGNSFYGTYTRTFNLSTVLSAITLGISYGFDTKPKGFDNKYLVTTWLSWGFNF